MVKINVRETLRKASRLLRQYGWQKGNTGSNPGDRMCIMVRQPTSIVAQTRRLAK